jgi:hypothetical protein
MADIAPPEHRVPKAFAREFLLALALPLSARAAPANKQLVFRKGKTIGSVTFARAANQNEIHSAPVARLVEAQLK